MEVRTYGKTALKDFKKKKAHITTRDFPESVQELRRKWAIKDGGETYLFFTRLNDGKKVVLVTQKL